MKKLNKKTVEFNADNRIIQNVKPEAIYLIITGRNCLEKSSNNKKKKNLKLLIFY